MAASPVFPAGEPNDALTPDRINERFAELEAPQGCFNDVDADSGTPSMMAEVQGPLWVTMDSEDRWLPSGGEEGSFPRPKSTFHCRAPPKRRDPTLGSIGQDDFAIEALYDRSPPLRRRYRPKGPLWVTMDPEDRWQPSGGDEVLPSAGAGPTTREPNS
eukprot:s3415_g1.t3